MNFRQFSNLLQNFDLHLGNNNLLDLQTFARALYSYLNLHDQGASLQRAVTQLLEDEHREPDDITDAMKKRIALIQKVAVNTPADTFFQLGDHARSYRRGNRGTGLHRTQKAVLIEFQDQCGYLDREEGPEEITAKASYFIANRLIEPIVDARPGTADHALLRSIRIEPDSDLFADLPDEIKAKIDELLSSMAAKIKLIKLAKATRANQLRHDRLIANKAIPLVPVARNDLFNSFGLMSEDVDFANVYQSLNLPTVPFVAPYDPLGAMDDYTNPVDYLPSFPLAVKLGKGTTANLPFGVEQVLKDAGFMRLDGSVGKEVDYAISLQSKPIAWNGVDLHIRPHYYLHSDAPAEDPTYPGKTSQCAVMLFDIEDKPENPAMVSDLSTHYQTGRSAVDSYVRYSGHQLKLEGLVGRGTHLFYSVVLERNDETGDFNRAIITLHGLLSHRQAADFQTSFHGSVNFELGHIVDRIPSERYRKIIKGFVSGHYNLEPDNVSTLKVAEQNRRFMEEVNAVDDAESIVLDIDEDAGESSMRGLSPSEQRFLDRLNISYAGSYNGLDSSEERRIRRGFTDFETYCKEQFAEEFPGIPFTLTTENRNLLERHNQYLLRRSTVDISRAEKERLNTALAPYFESQFHHAWRYIQTRNPLIHPRASYTIEEGVHPHRRSIGANIREHKNLIIKLWLAAKDEEAEVTDDVETLATRKATFCAMLKELNIAHNHDHGREDTVRLDHPTCGMGVRRRLLRTLRYHPLVSGKDGTIEDIIPHVKHRIVQLVTNTFSDFINAHFTEEAVNKRMQIMKNKYAELAGSTIESDDTWDSLFDELYDDEFLGTEYTERNVYNREKIKHDFVQFQQLLRDRLEDFKLESLRLYGRKYTQQSPTTEDAIALNELGVVGDANLRLNLLYRNYKSLVDMYLDVLFGAHPNEHGVDIIRGVYIDRNRIDNITSARQRNLSTAQDENGKTALHRACENLEESAIVHLLENGAITDIRDNNGCTAIDLLPVSDRTNYRIIRNIRNKFQTEEEYRAGALEQVLTTGRARPESNLISEQTVYERLTRGEAVPDYISSYPDYATPRVLELLPQARIISEIDFENDEDRTQVRIPNHRFGVRLPDLDGQPVNVRAQQQGTPIIDYRMDRRGDCDLDLVFPEHPAVVTIERNGEVLHQFDVIPQNYPTSFVEINKDPEPLAEPVELVLDSVLGSRLEIPEAGSRLRISVEGEHQILNGGAGVLYIFQDGRKVHRLTIPENSNDVTFMVPPHISGEVTIYINDNSNHSRNSIQTSIPERERLGAPVTNIVLERALDTRMRLAEYATHEFEISVGDGSQILNGDSGVMYVFQRRGRKLFELPFVANSDTLRLHVPEHIYGDITIYINDSNNRSRCTIDTSLPALELLEDELPQLNINLQGVNPQDEHPIPHDFHLHMERPATLTGSNMLYIFQGRTRMYARDLGEAVDVNVSIPADIHGDVTLYVNDGGNRTIATRNHLILD